MLSQMDNWKASSSFSCLGEDDTRVENGKPPLLLLVKETNKEVKLI